MPTASEIQNFEARVYKQARAGTPLNPGVPDALARLIIAQANHETGKFSSNAFRDGNNAFGYSFVPGARYQLAEPGRIADNGLPLARYVSLEDSVKEVVDWIYRRVKEGKFPANLSTIQTPEDYARYLKQAGYYGDTLANYTEGLRRFLKQVTDNPLIPTLLFVGLFWLVWRLTKSN